MSQPACQPGVPLDYTRALDYFQQAHAASDAQASVEATRYIDVMNVATGFSGPVDQIRLTAEGRKFTPMMLRKFGDPGEAPGPATSDYLRVRLQRTVSTQRNPESELALPVAIGDG